MNPEPKPRDDAEREPDDYVPTYRVKAFVENLRGGYYYTNQHKNWSDGDES